MLSHDPSYGALSPEEHDALVDRLDDFTPADELEARGAIFYRRSVCEQGLDRSAGEDRWRPVVPRVWGR